MRQQVEEGAREAILVEDAALIRMMGLPVLEALPSRAVPYERVDPFILVHEGRFRLSELAGRDTKHPHRGFDNLWYVLEGSASTGHSTGPGGSMERARLSRGSLLALRTGRGAWHAEALGADEVEEGQGDTEFRSVLFWVNLARKDKQVEPSAQVLQPEQIPVRHEGDAIVRVLVGEGSPVRAGHAGTDPRRRAARRRRVSRHRCHPGSRASPTCWRARAYSAPTAHGETAAARPVGSGRGVRGFGRCPRHPVPPHGRATVRGGARVQRAVRGLDEGVLDQPI